MFPDLENYNTKDIRSLYLYSWHFELFGLKELIECTNKSINEKIKANIDLCPKYGASTAYNEVLKYQKLMMEVQLYHNITPLAFQSYLLSLYSVVEASMDRFCKTCEEKYNLKVALEDFKDRGITRAVNYLEKVVQVETIKSDHRWGKMTIINDLRNDIIHSCGIIEKKKKVEVYKGELGVTVEDGRVYITYENIIDMYRYIEEFMELIFTRDFIDKTKSFIKLE